MKRILLFCFLITLGQFAAFSGGAAEKKEIRSGLVLPKEKIRREMFETFVHDIERLDGEGLIPRSNRPESWAQTTSRLATEASSAQDLLSFGNVFRRLNATYPNLHAKVFLLPELDALDSGQVKLPVEFAPATILRGQTTFQYKVSRVEQVLPGGPQLGDEVIAINGIPMTRWSEQNFIFCKFPLREQCELVFFENLRLELLDWTRRQPLVFELRRDNRTFSFQVPVEVKAKTKENENFDFMTPPCGVSSQRYPGWHLVYQGFLLCAFESPKHPGTVLLRIRDFMYGAYRGRPPVPLHLEGEVELFWTNYWAREAPKVRTLMIDVIDNHGGNEPIPYYAIIFHESFQEQYTQFKKIKEFERKDILESLYWGEAAKDIWLANIKKDGTFDRTKEGDFLPPIPQFCADQEKDCRDGLFIPKKHAFNGKIKLLINHECISSCVGFVFNIVDVMKSRVRTYGLPDSADSAYARLTLAEDVNRGGRVTTAVLGLNKFDEMTKDSPWIREAVSVSRSTDARGVVLSGIPIRTDRWIPKNWDQSEDQWVAEVLSQSLKDY